MDPTIQLNDKDGELLQDMSQYRRLICRLIYLIMSIHGSINNYTLTMWMLTGVVVAK